MLDRSDDDFSLCARLDSPNCRLNPLGVRLFRSWLVAFRRLVIDLAVLDCGVASELAKRDRLRLGLGRNGSTLLAGEEVSQPSGGL